MVMGKMISERLKFPNVSMHKHCLGSARNTDSWHLLSKIVTWKVWDGAQDFSQCLMYSQGRLSPVCSLINTNIRTKYMFHAWSVMISIPFLWKCFLDPGKGSKVQYLEFGVSHTWIEIRFCYFQVKWPWRHFLTSFTPPMASSGKHLITSPDMVAVSDQTRSGLWKYFRIPCTCL